MHTATMLRARLLGICGSVTLTVACGGGSESPAAPTPPPTSATTVTISGLPAAFYRGQVAQLTASASSGGSPQDVTAAATWRSSDSGVASVSASGVLTGIAIGTAEIAATYQGSTGTVSVPVREVSSATRAFDVAVLVDSAGPQPASSELDRVMQAAAAKLLEKTGVVLTPMGVAGVSGPSASAQVQSYLPGRQSAPPEGIVLLSNDSMSATFGGYSISIAPPFPFQNEYPSPVPTVGSSRVYVAVVDFDHMYARCGYDDNLNHISSTSIGGECRNRPGTPCVQVGTQWMCNDALNDLYANHDYFTGCTVVHEFMHPFGSAGSFDHYGTAQCTQRTGMTAGDAANRVLFQQNCGMCPDVYPLFRRR
jgi:Bacterial Ig-like domain (group 2)